MLKVYLFSILLFYITFAIFSIRYSVNKKKIVATPNKEGKFIYIRLIAISCIPILNIIGASTLAYYSIFLSEDSFVMKVSKTNGN